MTTIISGSSPSITFSDSTTQTTAFTSTPSVTSITTSADASINGLTVGRGAGSVSSNTAVGASALAGNSTGTRITALGYLAGNTVTGTSNVFVGAYSGSLATSGVANTYVGDASGPNNTTSTGSYNTGLGQASLYQLTSGSYNIAVGGQALYFNTTASNNTAVGYQAGYTNQTGAGNTIVGYQAGYQIQGSNNTAFGNNAGAGGAASSGTYNSSFGMNAGSAITSGSKNTIIGGYTGNQGGLDIRTASNYIVLSDGDGNPKAVSGAYPNGAGSYAAYTNAWTFGNGGTAATNDGVIFLNGTSYGAGYGPAIQGRLNGGPGWTCGSYSWVIGGSSNSFFTCQNSTGGVYLNGSSATSWTAVSDETRKIIIEPIADAARKVSTLRAVIGRLKTDDESVRRPYLIAQDVQAVLPEAVSQTEDKEGAVLGLSYTEVIPLLVAAIKEQQATITQLKARLDAANL